MAEKGKTIEELKDKVHNGLDLLSDEDLSLLFQEAESVSQAAPSEPAAQPQPSNAPAPAEPAPPAGETAKGQANLMNLMPDKFKDTDEAASLQKMLKAMQEQEAELTRKSQELSQLQNVVHELSRPVEPMRQQIQQPQRQAPEPQAQEVEMPEVDDLSFLDAPVSNTRAIAEAVARQIAEDTARRVATEHIRDYDTFSMRRSTFERFRSEHPDFDSLKVEFSEACRLHPEWDNDINGLPKLYELAKTLASARRVGQPNAPASQQTVDIDKLKAEIRAEVEASSFEKAKQAIKEEIMKRKAASGIMSTNSGTTPAERVAPNQKTVPLTREEQVFKDMVDSGPKSLDVLSPWSPSLSVERATK